MILSEQKPFEEILSYLEGEDNIFILGCNGCAQSSGSGGPLQVAEMKQKLEEAGKNITGTNVIDFLCEKALVKSRMRTKADSVNAADSILVMTCGLGVQAVAATTNKPCHPACNTMNLGGSRGEWPGAERCIECGDCLLEYTGGICPLTSCTKGLINGACGGASAGRCELSKDRECGWEVIYHRLKATNRLEQLNKLITPKDWSKAQPDLETRATSRYAMEQPSQ